MEFNRRNCPQTIVAVVALTSLLIGACAHSSSSEEVEEPKEASAESGEENEDEGGSSGGESSADAPEDRATSDGESVRGEGAIEETNTPESGQKRRELREEVPEQVRDHIRNDIVPPDHEMRAVFGDKIELLGFDLEGELRPGNEVEFTWYWRALEPIPHDWTIFIHFDSENREAKPVHRRQNLDHVAVNGQLPTSKWPPGLIVVDSQPVEINETYPAGPAIPYIGFYRGKQRLPITDVRVDEIETTQDKRLIGPELRVQPSEK